MADKLIEAMARALFNAENEWRKLQEGISGEPMDDRAFKVTIVEWRLKARAALAAIEASGTHVVVPVIPTERMMYSHRQAGEEVYATILAARPKVLP